jgi:hypothetical protein
MTIATEVLLIVAVLLNGVVYGTDACAAVVMRSAYARVDDDTMTRLAGWGHYYGDRRMPVFGVGGLVSVLIAISVAALAGATIGAILAAVALTSLLLWLLIYTRIAKPINEQQKRAAKTGEIPADARALQERWDSVLNLRVGLQAIAIGALCTAVALT